MTASNVAVLGVQLSILGLFAVVWGESSSAMALAGLALVVVGSAVVGFELVDPL
jgi:hypothetical protein